MFETLPKDDDLVNFARLLFVLLLSSHLSLCLVTARSSWSRILRRFGLNPLRRRLWRRRAGGMSSSAGSRAIGGVVQQEPGQRRTASASAHARETSAGSSHRGEGHDGASDSPEEAVSNAHIKTSTSASELEAQPSVVKPRRGPKGIKRKPPKPPRRWGKLARNALAGLLLWAVVAGAAYASGYGRLRRGNGEKEGEEARFTRASEILGLFGAAVGFVMPSLVWMIIFWVRRPRTILPIGEDRETARDLERRPLLPRSSDDVNEGTGGGRGAKPRGTAEEQQGSNGGEHSHAHLHRSVQAVPSAEASRDHTLPPEDEEHRGRIVRAWVSHEHGRDGAANGLEEQTRILLAKKERQMQRKTRGQRRWQDLFVLGGVLPLGLALLILGAIELQAGGY